MAYRELSLPRGPAPHAACLWTRDPEPVASVGRILPDACVDVVWVRGDRLVAAGPAPGPAPAALPAGAAAAGVRFRVGAAGSAVGVPARELRDRNVDLAEVWGARAAGRLAARLERAATPAAAVAAPVAPLGGQLPPAGQPHPPLPAPAPPAGPPPPAGP